MSPCCGSCKFGTYSKFEDFGNEFEYAYLVNLEKNKKKLEEFDSAPKLYAFIQAFGDETVSSVLKKYELETSKIYTTKSSLFCEHCARNTWWYLDRGQCIQMALVSFFYEFEYWKKFEQQMELFQKNRRRGR